MKKKLKQQTMDCTSKHLKVSPPFDSKKICYFSRMTRVLLLSSYFLNHSSFFSTFPFVRLYIFPFFLLFFPYIQLFLHPDYNWKCNLFQALKVALSICKLIMPDLGMDMMITIMMMVMISENGFIFEWK